MLTDIHTAQTDIGIQTTQRDMQTAQTHTHNADIHADSPDRHADSPDRHTYRTQTWRPPKHIKTTQTDTHNAYFIMLLYYIPFIFFCLPPLLHTLELHLLSSAIPSFYHPFLDTLKLHLLPSLDTLELHLLSSAFHPSLYSLKLHLLCSGYLRTTLIILCLPPPFPVLLQTTLITFWIP